MPKSKLQKQEEYQALDEAFDDVFDVVHWKGAPTVDARIVDAGYQVFEELRKQQEKEPTEDFFWLLEAVRETLKHAVVAFPDQFEEARAHLLVIKERVQRRDGFAERVAELKEFARSHDARKKLQAEKIRKAG